MGAYTGIKNLFEKNGKSLTYWAEKIGYAKDNLLILQGEEETLKKDFPETYDNLTSCQYHSDRRSPFEYGQDLVATWVLEDWLLETLKKNNDNFSIKLDGLDKNRKILPASKVSTNSDYLISFSNKNTPLEFVSNFTGLWDREHKWHLRDEKFNKLCQTNSLCVGISFNETATKFFIFDFADTTNIKHNYICSHPPYGGKPAYEITLSDHDLFDFSSTTLIKKIEEALTN